MMKYSSLTALFMGLIGFLNAQIVSISPAFPTENDLVTITFDASQGSGGLIGESQVYGHFGVITSASSSNTDWRHVVGNWGVADPTTAMTNIGNNKHTFTYDIRSFHSVPGSETVLRLSMVFRSDLEKINSSFLLQMRRVNTIAEVFVNAQLNPIVTVHLQQELDVITTNLDDSVLMVYEFKKGKVDQAALSQTISYLRLLSIRFPDKQVFGNIIGTKVESGMKVPDSHKGSVKLVKMRTQANPNRIRFEEVKDKE